MNYKKLSVLLVRKIAAVEADDIAVLDEIIKDEQVYLLLSRGFDRNIANFRGRMGLKGENLGDIIGELPEDERPRFSALHRRLRSAVGEAGDMNEKCQRMTEAKLHVIGKKLKELDKSGSVSYGKDAAGGKPGIFSKTI